MGKNEEAAPGSTKKNEAVLAVEEENDLSEDDAEYSPEEKAEFESLYESSMKNYKEGEIIAGTVVSITDESFLVDIGFKSEGFIDRSEFPGKGSDIKVGDEVEVFLDKTEDNDGQIVLTKEKANRIKMWKNVEDLFSTGEIVEGTVVSKAKGGLTVDIGLKAFLPGSQIDLRPIRDMDRLLGQTRTARGRTATAGRPVGFYRPRSIFSSVLNIPARSVYRPCGFRLGQPWALASSSPRRRGYFKLPHP